MIPLFWMEPTGETRTRRLDPPCDCGDPDCPVNTVTTPLYRRTDTGEVIELRGAPVGAVYDADWLHDYPRWCGPDGRAIHVVTPGGIWHVDGEASNCTRKGDASHKCWIRHGDPTHPETLHVDKNGETCSAGAGSILCGGYHGFLHHGHLT